MLRSALVLMVLLTACASQTRKPAGIGRVREQTDLGSLLSYAPGGKVSTCTQLGLALKDVNQLVEVKTRMASLQVINNRCEMSAAVGKCEIEPAVDSDVTIYSEIYYYAPVYTRGAAIDICRSTGGSFSYF